MAGYIGSKSSVTLVDGYSEAEADAEFVTKTGDSMTGDLSFGDSDKAIFGAGSDLQVSHDGNNSLIAEVGTGNLHITAQDLRLQSANNQDTIKCVQNGAVTLYYDNASKLATTSTGIDVTGTLTATKLVSANGILELDDDGSHNGIINSPASMRINIDSDNNSSGESFQIGHNQTAIDNNNVLFKVQDDGNVGIGTSSPSANLEITQSGNNVGLLVAGGGYNYTAKFESSDAEANIIIEDSNSTNDGNMIGVATNDMYFITNSAERMRIDSSGNLLVGKSSSSSSVAGFMVEPDGDTYITAEGAEGRVLYANRLTSDGDIMQFAKDGTTVGSISSNNATNLQINSQGGTFAIKTINTERYSFDQEQIYPWNNGECNLGLSYRRFDVVYAATGSINTSDQTQKQDIESLTATEMLVGKRLSALFKTFRWKNRVAEKGDSARTHTGIMAQEVQAAFTAEGLDASNYALFCSDTWWEHDVEVPAVEAVAEVTDEDGNVTTEAVEAVDAYTRTDEYKTEDEAPEGAISKTLLGIRYPELLSFVAAYNEQRFASIEARLTALEA